MSHPSTPGCGTCEAATTDALNTLHDAVAAAYLANVAIRTALRAALEEGATWAEVAHVLGVTDAQARELDLPTIR